MRQIALDTETTGLEPSLGHRIIEIGGVELVDRKPTGNKYRQYINPEREVEASALEVHGITNDFLSTKPLFEDIVDDFLEYVKGAELIIHNAPFDVGFINHELKILSDSTGKNLGKIEDYCSIVDTLVLAKKKYPGKRNNLDALAERLSLTKTHTANDGNYREQHAALLDSEILADVYLIMTGGQRDLSLADQVSQDTTGSPGGNQKLTRKRTPLPVLKASENELERHKERLAAIAEKADLVWPE